MNKITQVTYDKWHPTFSRELNNKQIEMNELTKDDTATRVLYNTYLPYLADLNWIFNQAEVDGKQDFLKGIFWGGFTKEKIGGRTDLINPMFYENSLKINELLRVKNKGKLDGGSSFPTCTPNGNEVEPFLLKIEKILFSKKCA